jgi:hypothetical protein
MRNTASWVWGPPDATEYKAAARSSCSTRGLPSYRHPDTTTACRRARSRQGQCLRWAAEGGPALTAPARAGLSVVWVGTEKRAAQVEQRNSEEGGAPKPHDRVDLRAPSLIQDALRRCRLIRPAGKNCSPWAFSPILGSFWGLLGEPKSFLHGQDPKPPCGGVVTHVCLPGTSTRTALVLSVIEQLV